MLAAHPEVVAYRPFDYEPRVATYWMGVFRALSDPASYRRQLAPTGTIDGTWWLGEQTPLPRPIRDPALDPWLDVTAIGELAGVAQQRIERLYSEVAAAQGRPDAAFFVEKYRTDAVPELMLELYPRAREVMLVRDFRDMIASMFAYNEKRGRQGFRRDRATSDRDYILNDVGVSGGGTGRRMGQALGHRPPAPLRGPRPAPRGDRASAARPPWPGRRPGAGRADAGKPARSRQRIGGPPHRRRCAGVHRPLAARSLRRSRRLPAPRPSAGPWRPSATSGHERRDRSGRRLGGAATGKRGSHLGVPPVSARPPAARSRAGAGGLARAGDVPRPCGRPERRRGLVERRLPGRRDGPVWPRRPLGGAARRRPGGAGDERYGPRSGGGQGRAAAERQRLRAARSACSSGCRCGPIWTSTPASGRCGGRSTCTTPSPATTRS